ncbi:MAG: hypothetical protein U9P42_07970 [Candidatus Fermentibacteria bacterium]|nr:hypothetical protein [Candidatus Fermentibacteria bacterium]
MIVPVHEKLILNGKMTTVMSSPLVPVDHEMLVEQRDFQIPGTSITGSSACRRKYPGTREVKNHKFYLVRIEGKFKLRGDDPVLAGWFSGELQVPEGKTLQYPQMGQHPLHEKDLFTSVENGNAVKTWIRDNRAVQKREVSTDA